MRRIRIGVIGAGANSEWGLLPALMSADMTSPPDSGAWWSKRPAPGTAIRWQAPFRTDLLALCERDEDKRARAARTFHVASTSENYRAMLRETPLDAVFCENAATEDLPELVAEMARRGVQFLWLGGIHANTAGDALELAYWAASHGVRIWCARALRHAAAHRAALGLIKRGEIGDVTALCLRWNHGFCAAPEADSNARAATFAALDLLLACAATTPVSALLTEARSTSHAWWRFAGGATATAVFASADNWNAPLPRLEIVGTQGRFLVCHGGRKLEFFQPQEAARSIEPPGLAAHVSAANITGLGEDIKAFLTECAQETTAAHDWLNADWLEVARVLAALEAAARSLQSGQVEAVEKLRFETSPGASARREARAAQSPSPVLTLPLS